MLKTVKAKQTQAKILEAAKRVFGTKGFSNATIQDISEQADLGHGTFYLYFKDKKDVFYALVSQVEDELYSAQGGSDLNYDYPLGYSSYRALRKDIKAVIESFKNNAAIIKIYIELSLSDPDFRERYEATRARLIQRTEQILRKSNLKNVDFHIAAAAIAGMIEAGTFEWLKQSNKCSPDIEDVLPTITKLYFKVVS
jgi:AcrR family transcriptional regulator